MPLFLPRFGLDESWQVPAMRAFFFFFLLFKIWRVLAGNSPKVSAAQRLRAWCGCFCSEDVSGSALGRGAEGNGQGGGESRRVDAPGCSRGSRSADPGAGEPRGQARPQHPASSFNYLKSPAARRRVCDRPVSRRPPGAPTSCAASPVRPPAAGWPPPGFLCLLEALCGRGFGQESEVPATAASLPSLSPSGPSWQTCLILFFFFLMSFKDLSFSFYTLALPWNTHLYQQPQTVASAGLVSVNGFFLP